MPTKRLLILSGPTREYLDPVRYLSNASSGRQGIALATEALRRGYQVDLVQGPVHLEPPEAAEVHSIVSAQEMLDVALKLHEHCDILIGVAAVSDYRPESILTSKHKRSGKETWQLSLVSTPDILKTLADRKGDRVHVGFALETDDAIENGRRKLEAKKLDRLVVNGPLAIGSRESTYQLLSADSSQDLGRLSKEQLASKLLDEIDALTA